MPLPAVLSAARRRIPVLLLAHLLVLTAACGAAATSTDRTTPTSVATEVDDVGGVADPLVVSAIPDQDPQQLARLYGLVVDHLTDELGVPVEYVPVTDYQASVRLFRSGDLDLVWFGGLTGVQARLATDGAQVIAQRDIDTDFHSVFIANRDAGVAPFDDVDGLDALAGLRVTFGSESSTSGRLMPTWFLGQAGVVPDDFAGQPGYSGSHDTTIDLVESGTFEAGALNAQVWDARVEAGTVDTDRVQAVFTTPGYADYHWLLGPGAVGRFGDDLPGRVRDALLALSPDEPQDVRILELFGAEAFVPAQASDYDRIEQVGRELGLVGP